MNYDLKENFENMSRGELVAHIGMVKAELKDIYAKLCETRISNMKDDAVAFFIEELLDAEADEILDIKSENDKMKCPRCGSNKKVVDTTSKERVFCYVCGKELDTK